MPTAKIVTRLADSAASLADYLARLGYRVETVTPGQAESSPADLEITIEALPRGQAFQQASQLASTLDADVLVAPGVIEEVQQSQAHAAEPAAIEIPPERNAAAESRQAVGSRIERERLGEWRNRGQQMMASIAGRFGAMFRSATKTCITAAAQWGAKSKSWIAEAAIQAWQNAAKVAVLGKGKVEQLRQQAAQRARDRAVVKARRQELERQQRMEHQQQHEHRVRQAAAQAARSSEERKQQAALQAARLRERQEQEAALHQVRLQQEQEQQVRLLQAGLNGEQDQEEQDQQDEAEDAVPILAATPLLRAPQARSSLLAYTRSRDWKMAFIGAAAASAVIMVVSFSFLERTPASHPTQHPVPIPAASVQTSAPALMVPAPEIAPPPIPSTSARAVVKVPVVSPSLQPANVSQVELNGEDDSFQEVVVRHYPSHQGAKARTDAHGVKRISDLE